MKRNETRSLRKAQILQYQKSGQTVEAWCRNHQIKAHTLRYWLSKVTKVKPAQETVPSTPWVVLSPLLLSIEICTNRGCGQNLEGCPKAQICFKNDLLV